MRNAGKVISKTMILSHVWDYSFDPQTNIVDVLVSRLREKIDRPFEKKLLHTVRGRGLCPPRLSATARPLVYGLRLGVWYATLFVAGSLAIVLLTYLLDVGVARAARSADHRQQARHVRDGLRPRRPRRASPRPCRPSSRPRPSGCSCAWWIAAPKPSS